MSERLQRIEQLFHAALALPPAERLAYLERADASRDLVADVESLLRHHDAPTTELEAAVAPMVDDLFGGPGSLRDLPPGAMLGPYQIACKVGQGGMGAVYRARDTRLNRDVALKTLGGSFAATPEARARLLREARAAAALTHPNIATLHDIGETDESPWIVMELVAGISLRSRLIGGPLDESTWLAYATQIAAALEHAHARKIVHRDIKPENILISLDDTVKVIDFGLARAVQDDVVSPRTITEPTTFVGTLAYSAPERFSGGPATARGDVYSFGVVLYEMACGEHPFKNRSGPGLVAAIVSGDYRAVEQRAPSLRPAIGGMIRRCLALDPAERFANGTDVLAALRAVLAGETPQQPAAPPRLAILDFESLAGAADVDWLGTGIAETLSADFARIDAVNVASRGRVHQALRRAGDPLRDPAAAMAIGRDLGARWIIGGGYQQVGDRLRVTPKVIDATSGSVTSTEKIDGHRDELFDLQDRVVACVLEAITVRFGLTDQQKIVPAETRSMRAYEHYVRGRQQMYRMEAKSLEMAVHHFEQAIALDPGYALAHSALGTAHTLQFLRTSDRQDIAVALVHLERAIELDPELGEPYPWLAYLRLRRNDARGAVEAGRRGVILQPDLPEAHYFYGGQMYMAAETGLVEPSLGLEELAECIRLEPHFHPAWIVLGAAAMSLGAHDRAVEIFTEAIRLEAEPDLMYRFVGASTLRGIAHSRAARWEQARSQLADALEALKPSGHVYRDTFRTLAACSLGDIALRCGSPETALTHYRHAGRIIKEAPRTAGSVRLLNRASSGLAAAYAASGQARRGEALADEAAAQLEVIEAQIGTTTIECGLGQLCLGVAVAQLRLGRTDAAADMLDRARAAGWRDWPWLLADPELAPLRAHPVFVRFVDELKSAPRQDILLPVSSRRGHPPPES